MPHILSRDSGKLSQFFLIILRFSTVFRSKCLIYTFYVFFETKKITENIYSASCDFLL
ncbi:MAG: hypothetical protein GQF41_2307 [Candidatus Rifleibacterium amylolyticum]|nr:MAG: hypothetical protein GQF41_2307 [Candidatus Rifleibacterium amylolyticum]